MKKGLLVVVSGASGTGKGTVCKKVLEDMPNLVYSISATTRAPREGETDGVEYYFLTREEFQKKIDEKKFLEYANVYGNYYGTPLDKIEEQLERGKNVLLEIDTQGALNVQEKCPDGVYIFLLPPSLEELRARIEGRGTETPETLARRLQSAAAEIEIGRKYDYAVVNDSVEKAVEKVKSIIVAESCKVSRNDEKFKELQK